jgi:hypothetical protein
MKQKAITLVRDYFGCSLQEMKELSGLDRQQLASAIARERGISQEDCEFELIAY